MTQLNTIGETWIVESFDKLFGPLRPLVTPQALEGAGYQEVSEP